MVIVLELGKYILPEVFAVYNSVVNLSLVFRDVDTAWYTYTKKVD